MTPIEKNVRVVDEQGNEYEATYPKRAKGLVKHGRARFTDENTICLARPPENTEDKMNNEYINEVEIEKIEEAAESAAAAAEEYAHKISEEFDPEKLAREYDRKYGGATDALNGETVSTSKATEADGEITEAKVLALIERLTGITERMAETKFAYASVSDDKDLPDAYYEAVQSQHGCLNEHVQLTFKSVENLNATANRMLDYLEKKRANDPVSDREYLAFVKDFVANNRTGELPDFVELRKSFIN